MHFLLHHTVEHSAQSHPDKISFIYDGAELTYLELAQRMNGLAKILLKSGIRSGQRVGLLLPKSIETPIAVFGCLAAGTVIVPLDAQSPAHRLANIIDDADIEWLICLPEQERLLSRLCNDENLNIKHVIGLNSNAALGVDVTPWNEVSPLEKAPMVGLQEDDPAYLLYTSGSTGQPKGILHSHRSGLAYAKLAADTYNVSDTDILGNFAQLHFDQSTFEFYTAPLCAATTVLIPQALGFATASLADLIEKQRLTIWYSVPSVLIQLVTRDALVGKDISSLRWILFGGEPFPPQHLHKLMSFLPQAHFSNVYGPTEVNQCTYFNFDASEIFEDAVPIGNVWDNTECLVVDSNDQAVMAGDTGELLIRSSTMMLGYWGRPDLNQRAFFYRRRDGGLADRFYRTGDLVRARDDGVLEFLGRRDRQIKTRGHRVELDEVESVLAMHNDIEEAATFAVLDDDQATLIEAAVVARTDKRPSLKEINGHIAQHLPSYARPRKVTFLTEFPRTRTGKIDRRALATTNG